MNAAMIAMMIAMIRLAGRAVLTVTDAMFEVDIAPVASVTSTYTAYEAELDGLEVQEESMALETAVPFKYHW
jgi:hypothetical protein